MNYNQLIMMWKMTYRKDDNWRLSRGAYVFVIIGLLLLLSAISAVIIIIDPWTVNSRFSFYLLTPYFCVCVSALY